MKILHGYTVLFVKLHGYTVHQQYPAL